MARGPRGQDPRAEGSPTTWSPQPRTYGTGLPANWSNVISLFGLHRQYRGAVASHLAAFEMNSSAASRRISRGLRRIGAGEEACALYDVHVVADSLHERVAAYDLCGLPVRLHQASALVAAVAEGLWTTTPPRRISGPSRYTLAAVVCRPRRRWRMVLRHYSYPRARRPSLC